MLEIKGQVLHRVRLYLKFPGWLSDLNVLLTRKLPLFLLRLNKISGVRGNMCFGIIAENFEAFENDIFYCKVFCWCLRCVTFAVRFLGRFLGHDVCLWLQRSQGSHLF